jgi:hypothetical protein
MFNQRVGASTRFNRIELRYGRLQGLVVGHVAAACGKDRNLSG